MKRSTWISLAVSGLWLALIGIVLGYLHIHRLPVHSLPGLLYRTRDNGGIWGVAVLLGAYLAAIAIPLPTLAFALASGTAYGPFWGTVLAIIGYNLSTTVGFWSGRAIGYRFVQTHENAWMKKYDARLKKEGMLTVLFMRLFFFPSELVNFGCGMSSVRFQSVAAGSFLGSLPWIVTFALLGNTFRRPHHAWAVFLVIFTITVSVAFALRRSRWADKAMKISEGNPVK